MKQTQKFTAIIEYKNNAYVALCPELDIVSQGNSIEAAKSNLTEALQLFLNMLISQKFNAAYMQKC